MSAGALPIVGACGPHCGTRTAAVGGNGTAHCAGCHRRPAQSHGNAVAICEDTVDGALLWWDAR